MNKMNKVLAEIKKIETVLNVLKNEEKNFLIKLDNIFDSLPKKTLVSEALAREDVKELQEKLMINRGIQHTLNKTLFDLKSLIENELEEHHEIRAEINMRGATL